MRVLDAYAAFDSHFQRRGRYMGKNDLWIAPATVRVGGHLITADADFDALDPLFLTLTRSAPPA